MTTSTATGPPRPTHCLFVPDLQAGHAAYALVYLHSLHTHYALGTVDYRPLDSREAVENRVREAVRDRHPEYAEWAEVTGPWRLASDVLVALHEACPRGDVLGLAAGRELLARGDAPWMVHKRVDHGQGAGYWCECACGMWAWTGTYHGDRGRRAAGRKAYSEHLERRALDEALALGDSEAYAKAVAALDGRSVPAGIASRRAAVPYKGAEAVPSGSPRRVPGDILGRLGGARDHQAQAADLLVDPDGQQRLELLGTI